MISIKNNFFCSQISWKKTLSMVLAPNSQRFLCFNDVTQPWPNVMSLFTVEFYAYTLPRPIEVCALQGGRKRRILRESSAMNLDPGQKLNTQTSPHTASPTNSLSNMITSKQRVPHLCRQLIFTKRKKSHE